MRTRYRKILVAAGATLASMALLASAADAATPPLAPYQDFAGCPSHSENEFVAYCAKIELTGGHLKLGTRNIPITNPILLRGGSLTGNGEFVNNSEGGIKPVRQVVEGGLVGLTGNPTLDELLGSQEALKVYATIESAGQPSSLEHFPFTVPVKVHLENQFLGNACYIGSNANPISLALTTGATNPPGPNKPITGVESSEFESEAGRPAVLFSGGGTFVDNAFAVPGATGCRLNIGSWHINIDNLVNSAAHLPSAAGNNEAVFGFNLSIVDPEVAYAS